jgi:SAM-dependent methyltransferase
MTDRATHSRDLRRARSTWERLGREDPMWAVLTRPEGWDEEEFFSTGADEIGAVMRYAETLGFPKQRRGALDFGCGLGRLTRALADHFDQVVGVDVAESMVEGARQLNGGVAGCTFRHNPTADLGAFDSAHFDLVYSNITLQHMSPTLAAGYIREFLRVVAPEGLVLFQVPTGYAEQAAEAGSPARRQGLGRLRNVPAAAVRVARQLGRGRPMEMNWIPEGEVVELIQSSGGRLLDVRKDDYAGPQFESRRFAAVRR